LPPTGSGERLPVEFVDLDTGQRYAAAIGPLGGRRVAWPDGRDLDDGGRWRVAYPRRLHVEQRPVTPADFAGVVGALEEVFRAAIATGNPVRWH
jgi:hypothetical protein